MKIYFDLVKFNFLRFFSYPFEILASILKRIIEILFLILFWSLVVKNANVQIDLYQIISYFFISMGVRDLVMSHWGPFGEEVGSQIKSGYISNYLIKPISIVPTLYARAVGKNGMRILLALLNLGVGLFIYPPKNIVSIILFFVFLACAWSISFSYNLFQGTLYFHLIEANGVVNALNNIIRVLSGELAPLFLFPDTLREILRFTPFPSMVYGPTIALSTTQVDTGVLLNIGVSLFWAISLHLATYIFWQRSIKNYEAIGI